jgi:hypothetical protein
MAQAMPQEQWAETFARCAWFNAEQVVPDSDNYRQDDLERIGDDARRRSGRSSQT